jgi:hypothetical protein
MAPQITLLTSILLLLAACCTRPIKSQACSNGANILSHSRELHININTHNTHTHYSPRTFPQNMNMEIEKLVRQLLPQLRLSGEKCDFIFIVFAGLAGECENSSV